jgi:hypothetical protein
MAPMQYLLRRGTTNTFFSPARWPLPEKRLTTASAGAEGQRQGMVSSTPDESHLDDLQDDQGRPPYRFSTLLFGTLRSRGGKGHSTPPDFLKVSWAPGHFLTAAWPMAIAGDRMVRVRQQESRGTRPAEAAVGKYVCAQPASRCQPFLGLRNNCQTVKVERSCIRCKLGISYPVPKRSACDAQL